MTTQIGLSAANFLLLAEGHLSKAKEKLTQEPMSATMYRVDFYTKRAANSVRHALELLKQEKEEPCNKP